MRRLFNRVSLAGVLAACVLFHGAAEAQMRELPIEAAASRLADVRADAAGRPRIIGGAQAIPGSFPFQVALVLAEAAPGQEFSGFFCGGTLVGDRHVLTAAHCLMTGDSSHAVSEKDISIYLGHTSFRGGERIPVRRLIRHPQWNQQTLVNDIALLELERPPSAAARTAKIAVRQPADTAPLATAKVIGWGALDTSGPSARHLRETTLDVVDQKTCSQRHLAWQDKQSRSIVGEIVTMIGLNKASEARMLKTIKEGAANPVSPNALCAGADVGFRSSCYGDSGGPLFVSDAGGAPVQIGIVSWGVNCSTADVYAVFTDVSKYADWLKAAMTN